MSKYIIREENLQPNGTDLHFNENINIAICSDKNVIRPMGVLIYSIIKNTERKCAFHIFFNGDMPEKDKDKFLFLSKKYKTPIIIYFVNNSYFENFSSTSNITVTSYYRLVAPEVLDEKRISKFIYLDTDMLCINDIANFYDNMLSDKIVLVSKDSGFTYGKLKEHWKVLNLTTNNYFNSGSMLISIENYLKNDIGKKAMSLLQNNKYAFMDQDVLNLLLDGKIIFDETYKFNCMTSVPDELNDNDKIIIHFTGTRKPWKKFTETWGSDKDNSGLKRNTYYKLYRQYVMESPWGGEGFDMPKNSSEWRYLAEMYFSEKRIIEACKAYIKYLKSKCS